MQIGATNRVIDLLIHVETTLQQPHRSEPETKNSVPVRIMTATGSEPPRLIRQSAWSIALSQRELIFLTSVSAPGLVALRHFIDSKVD